MYVFHVLITVSPSGVAVMWTLSFFVLPKMSAPVVAIMRGCRCGCEILFLYSVRTPRFTTALRLALTASTRFTLSECCEKWSG